MKPTPKTPSTTASPATAKLVSKLLDLPESDQKSDPAAPFESFSWGEPLAQVNRPAASDYRPEGMDQWLAWIASGSDEQVKQALEQFELYRPATAVPELLQTLFNKKLNEDNRLAALLTLGAIGHASAVPQLLAQQKNLPYNFHPALCHVLTVIDDPRAVPYLQEKAKNGLYVTRALALFGLGSIGSPDAIPGLVEDAKAELNQLYMEDNDNPLQNSSSFGLMLLGAAVSAWQMDKWATRNATLMTNPYITLDQVVDAPGEVQRMWLLHLRESVLTHLVTLHGPTPLLACRPRTKQSVQRLMIALPMLTLYDASDEYINDLIASTKSRRMAERLLAYEQFIYLTAQTGNPTFHDWALRGLQDKDKKLRSAVAAAIIFYEAASLTPHALELARAKSADIRGSMVMPVVYGAVAGDASAQAVVQELLQDKDQNVRDYAARLWKLGQASLAEFTPPSPPSAAPTIETVQSILAPSTSTPTPIPESTVTPPEPSTSPRFCMYCGQPLRPGARFCASCGKRIV